jgi:hypothetical protein
MTNIPLSGVTMSIADLIGIFLSLTFLVTCIGFAVAHHI